MLLSVKLVRGAESRPPRRAANTSGALVVSRRAEWTLGR